MSSKLSNVTEAASSVSSEKPSSISQQKNLKQALMGWLQLNSFGGRLFWMIMVGALTGVGGMAFLFSEMVKYQAEDQVRSTLDGQVNAISSVTQAAETLAYGLGVSATTLHERQAQYADTYRELTLQLFERRPEFVVGLGLAQRKNGLIVDLPWLFPYYSVESFDVGDSGRQQPIRYEDFADDTGEFYPDSQQYSEYFLPQRNIWAEPYQKGKSQVLTYYLPLQSGDGRWLGTTLVDIDGEYLSKLLNVPVFRGMGHFLLVTRSGNIIADPANPENNLKTYDDIADLTNLWQDVNQEGSGFLEGETGYWAYSRVPGQDWLVFGFVPYGAVFNRLALITVSATLLMVALLSVAILLAIRSLNRKLRPVLNQCNQLAQTDTGLLAKWDREDELNQLSLAFFNMLEQLNLNQETIRRHEQKIEKETLYADQISERLTGFTTLIRQQVGKQQTLIHQVQQLVAGTGKKSQSVELQLDAVNTLGRALTRELSRMPASTSMEETQALLEQQLQTLIQALEVDKDASTSEQCQLLLKQLMGTLTTLKAHERKRPSINSLWQQVRNIAQAGQSAAVDSQAIEGDMQSINQHLTDIEKIATITLRKARPMEN